MARQGWYYLHTNGSLIFKPDGHNSGVAADIRESDFARCMWPMDPEDRMGAWLIVIEGAALGANPARVSELAKKWGCDETDIDKFAEHAPLKLTLDGNQWCATKVDFINLQESSAGFGATKFDAVVALAKNLGLKPGKMWRATLLDLLKVEPVVAP